MTYTVSAPTGSGFPQYPRITAAPYPTVHSHLASIHEEPRYGSRAPSTRDHISRAPSPISDAESGSTYYVIPTPGQKVKVLVSHQQGAYLFFSPAVHFADLYCMLVSARTRAFPLHGHVNH